MFNNEEFRITKCGLSVSNFGRVKGDSGNITLGYLTESGYRQVSSKNRVLGCAVRPLVHRLVAEAFLQLSPDSKLVVNHIDGNRENNTVENLEVVTHFENLSLPKHKPGKGVQRYNGAKPWRVVIKIEGKPYSVGYYATRELAEDCYKLVHIACYGVPADSVSFSVSTVKPANKAALKLIRNISKGLSKLSKPEKRAGHPGSPVRIKGTSITFKSQTEAAQVLQLKQTDISNSVLLDRDIEGIRFERVAA